MKKDENSILIVEDDILSATYLSDMLKDAGYKVVDIVSRGDDAIQKAKELLPSLVLMDVLLKDYTSGCKAALKISQNNPNISIIFLTAHADKEMLEYAQKSNACAYLMKPYRDDEILATIYLTLTRNKEKNSFIKQNKQIKLKNNYIFDTQTRVLSKDNKHIPLTPSKIKLIEILVQNIDNIVSFEQIINFIWGEPREASTLRSLVYRTKQSIKDELINNINGVGYSINSK